MFVTREANTSDLQQIISIHMEAFPGFFLTQLGPKFLRELYTGFISNRSSTIVIADKKGEILGFAAGTISPDNFFKCLRWRRWPFFLMAAIPGIIKSPGFIIRKLWGALRYSGDAPESLTGGALLSSLAVSPRAQNQGVGKALVGRICEFARTHKSKLVYIITDKDENSSVIRFYEGLDFTVDTIIKKENNRQMFRLVRFLDSD